MRYFKPFLIVLLYFGLLIFYSGSSSSILLLHHESAKLLILFCSAKLVLFLFFFSSPSLASIKLLFHIFSSRNPAHSPHRILYRRVFHEALKLISIIISYLLFVLVDSFFSLSISVLIFLAFNNVLLIFNSSFFELLVCAYFLSYVLWGSIHLYFVLSLVINICSRSIFLER